MSYIVEPYEHRPGVVLSVMALTYGRARITIGRDIESYDDSW